MSRALIPVLLVIFLDLLGFGIVIPLLTFYSEEFGATPLQVTLLMAVYSLAQFAFAPLWGALSDRVGRRPVLMASIAATVICLSGFAAANTLWMLFLFRTLHGACAANISTARPHKRTHSPLSAQCRLRKRQRPCPTVNIDAFFSNDNPCPVPHRLAAGDRHQRDPSLGGNSLGVVPDGLISIRIRKRITARQHLKTEHHAHLSEVTQPVSQLIGRCSA